MKLRGAGFWAVSRKLALLPVFLALLGCQTRSISNAGNGGAANPFYKGELSAYDVLGLDATAGYSDAEIQNAMATRRRIVIPKGSAVLLIQSVSSFSGVPRDLSRYPKDAPWPPIPYSQLFRMAAARGGFDTVIVYWGILESATEKMGGKAISWLPIIGGVIPDENQHMRLRLILTAIDVRTGQWETISPEPVDDEATSNQHSRAASDQRQIALLKAKAYTKAADAVALRFGG
jgi:hypothetical protein